MLMFQGSVCEYHKSAFFYTPVQFTLKSGLTQDMQEGTAVVNAEHAGALHKYELQFNVVANFEQQHIIKSWWTPQHPKYVMAFVKSNHTLLSSNQICP